MARNLSRRPRRGKHEPEKSIDSLNLSQNQVRMLPRLFVRMGGAVITVAITVLLLTLQQQMWPSDNNEITESKPQRRINTRPVVELLETYPHDAAAFTQGFTVLNQANNPIFIESTGLFGQSSLRHVEIETGKILQQYNLSPTLFGEGVTFGPKNELVVLTWKSKIGLVFDLKQEEDKSIRFVLKREFSFESITGEGWGITFDGTNYAVSDGSSTITFWNISTMKEVKRVEVSLNGQKIAQLNELEFAKGFIYANVWYQPYIVKIDPETGTVVTVFDLSTLISDARVDVASGAVLNGIAYDQVEEVFYITGKLWPVVYKVVLID